MFVKIVQAGVVNSSFSFVEKWTTVIYLSEKAHCLISSENKPKFKYREKNHNMRQWDLIRYQPSISEFQKFSMW